MPVPGQGSQCCPGLARGLSGGLFERVCYKPRVARRLETDFPALQGVLLGTAPLGCVEITFCCSRTGREELVLLGSFGSPSFCFLFTKAAAARWLSWPIAPQGESSLLRKLVPGARSSQVAHAPGTPMSSAGFYSCPLAFSLFGERGVVWKIIILFFPFWHSGCLNQGRCREAGKRCSACSLVRVMFG